MDETSEKLDLLTINAESYVNGENNQQDEKHWNPIIRTIFQGVYDNESPLANLRGIPHVVQVIFKYVQNYWKLHIQFGQKEDVRNYEPTGGEFVVKLNDQIKYRNYGFEDDSNLSRLEFPDPSDININMMPFIMAKNFEETFLPDFLRPYFDKLILKGILEKREELMAEEMGKVCYLSVHESWVDENVSQRRQGLHTESPGKLFIAKETKEINDEIKQDLDENEEEIYDVCKGQGSSAEFSGIHGWGMSIGYLEGGIYLASTATNSCKLWDCQIIPDEDEGRDIIGELGDIEHLRDEIGVGEVMEENMMYWITDRTPHESLPLKERTYRQWFRLVTRGVSLWFQDHSTENPRGIVPDPQITKIVRGSKFDEKTLVIVSPDDKDKQIE